MPSPGVAVSIIVPVHASPRTIAIVAIVLALGALVVVAALRQHARSRRIEEGFEQLRDLSGLRPGACYSRQQLKEAEVLNNERKSPADYALTLTRAARLQRWVPLLVPKDVDDIGKLCALPLAGGKTCPKKFGGVEMYYDQPVREQGVNDAVPLQRCVYDASAALLAPPNVRKYKNKELVDEFEEQQFPPGKMAQSTTMLVTKLTIKARDTNRPYNTEAQAWIARLLDPLLSASSGGSDTAWHAFDNDPATACVSSAVFPGANARPLCNGKRCTDDVGVELRCPFPIVVSKYVLMRKADQEGSPTSWKLMASDDDGKTFVQLHSVRAKQTSSSPAGSESAAVAEEFPINPMATNSAFTTFRLCVLGVHAAATSSAPVPMRLVGMHLLGKADLPTPIDCKLSDWMDDTSVPAKCIMDPVIRKNEDGTDCGTGSQIEVTRKRVIEVPEKDLGHKCDQSELNKKETVTRNSPCTIPCHCVSEWQDLPVTVSVKDRCDPKDKIKMCGEGYVKQQNVEKYPASNGGRPCILDDNLKVGTNPCDIPCKPPCTVQWVPLPEDIADNCEADNVDAKCGPGKLKELANIPNQADYNGMCGDVIHNVTTRKSTKTCFKGPCPQDQEEDGVDYETPGEDLQYLENVSYKDCKQFCANNNECKLITFWPGQNKCWLKKVARNGKRNPDRISWIKGSRVPWVEVYNGIITPGSQGLGRDSNPRKSRLEAGDYGDIKRWLDNQNDTLSSVVVGPYSRVVLYDGYNWVREGWDYTINNTSGEPKYVVLADVDSKYNDNVSSLKVMAATSE